VWHAISHSGWHKIAIWSPTPVEVQRSLASQSASHPSAAPLHSSPSAMLSGPHSMFPCFVTCYSGCSLFNEGTATFSIEHDPRQRGIRSESLSATCKESKAECTNLQLTLHPTLGTLDNEESQSVAKTKHEGIVVGTSAPRGQDVCQDASPDPHDGHWGREGNTVPENATSNARDVGQQQIGKQSS
jgi:hypothetical protein